MSNVRPPETVPIVEKTGELFEKLVAKIQARIDPNAEVTHNEFLVDRLAQRRQFDVVVRGQFAGQQMLGVIECKDLKRPIGTPEIDAFNTKSQDIKANFKVIASRRGFTKPALEKAEHYGIKLISLLEPEALQKAFELGDWWSAKLFRWGRLSIQAHPADPTVPIPEVSPDQLLIGGGRVFDWFTNYLLRTGHDDKSIGWVVGFQLSFDPMIDISISGKYVLKCGAISFYAERECHEFERYVPLTAEAFVDWHSKSATIPPSTTVRMQNVPMDFREWPPRDPTKQRVSCFLPITIEAHEHQFDAVTSAPDLEAM